MTMLDLIFRKLVELAIGKWKDQRQPRVRVARAFAQLHSSLVRCHKTYVAYCEDPQPYQLHNWGVAIDSLMTTLADVGPTLGIFDDELYQELQYYLNSESRLFIGFNTSASGELVKMELQELARLTGVPERLQKFSLVKESGTYSDDFSETEARLAQFIRTHFKIDEIYGSLS